MRISDWSSDVCSSDLFAGVCISDQLGDHGVIEHADLAAFHHAIIDSDAIHLQRRIVADEPPGRREETPIRILGIDAVFYGPASEITLFLRNGQRLPGRHPNHMFTQHKQMNSPRSITPSSTLTPSISSGGL